MITGRVLDTSAILDAATGRTVYLRALIVSAVELGMTLAVPVTAWVHAQGSAPDEALPGLALVRSHPNTVLVPLDAGAADRVGALARDAELRGLPWTLRAVHVAVVAAERDWPVITADAEELLTIDPALSVHQLP